MIRLDGISRQHAPGGTFLTGVRIKKTAGSDIYAGASIDQVVAQQIGHLTRFPSLELTCDAVRKAGQLRFRLFLRLRIQSRLALADAAVVAGAESAPGLRAAFRRRLARTSARRISSAARPNSSSILDFVLDDADAVQRKLNGRDRQKLDQYLTERARDRATHRTARSACPSPNPDVDAPAGIPPSFDEHIALMFDMLLLAFQTDSTRVATMLLAGEGSNRTFTEIGLSEGHHNLTHHQERQPR